MSTTKFHTHTKKQAKLVLYILIFSSLSFLNIVFRTFQITGTYVDKTGLQEFDTLSWNKGFPPRFETTELPSSSRAKGLEAL